MIASILLVLTSLQQREDQPRFTEAQRASLLALARKLDRPDVAVFISDPATKVTFADQGDAGVYRWDLWNAEHTSLGALHFEVAKPMDQVITLHMAGMPVTSNGPNLPEATLTERAEMLARRFLGATPLVRVRYQEDTLANGVQFDYYPQGSTKERSDRITLFLHPQTAQVLVAYLPIAREDERYQGDPALSLELLEGRALSLFADARPFPQGEITASYVHVGVPVPYGTFDMEMMRPPTQGLAARLFSPALNARYLEMWRLKETMPLYKLLIRSSEPRTTYGVALDARNGNLLWTIRAEGVSGPEPKAMPPLPDRIKVGRTTGNLSKREESSPTSSSRAVVVYDANRVLAGLFEAKSGTLWLRRTEKEPYRAFRPEPKLRQALEAQVRLGAALAPTKSGQ